MNNLDFFLVVVCSMFLVSSCSDNVQSNYADKAKAISEGRLVEKGWMPNQIPETSYDIRESHNLDLNTGQGKFFFKPEEAIKYCNEMYGFLLKNEELSKVQGLDKKKGSWKFFRIGNFVIGVEIKTGEGFWYVNPKIK